MRLKQLHKFSRAIQLETSKHYMAAATGGKLQIYEKDTFSEVASFGPMKYGYDIHITKDERNVIVPSNNNPWIYIWSLDHQEDARRIRIGKAREYVHEGEMALSLDGKKLYVVVGQEKNLCDKIVEVDLLTYEEVGCYFAEDSYVFRKIIPLEDGTYFIMGYERGIEHNADFIAKFDGREIIHRIMIMNTLGDARYIKEQNVITWYETSSNCVMCYDGREKVEVLAQWYRSFEYFTRVHYYDKKQNRLYMESLKGLYVIDTITKEVIDCIVDGPEIRDFLWFNDRLCVYDDKGVLYEIEK